MLISIVRTFLFVLIVLVFVAIGVLFFLSAKPAVEIPPALDVVGQTTPVSVTVKAPHGVRHVVAYIEQNGARHQVWETSQPATRWRWQRNVPDTVANFNVGTRSVPQLKDGDAKLVVEATSNDFRAATARAEKAVKVSSQPPTVSVDSDQHYLYLGMAELVTFNLGGGWTEGGVRVGDYTFRAWQMPGGKPGYFSIFAYPWNTPEGTAPLVYAKNAAGDTVTGGIVYQFPKKEQPKYRIRDLKLDEKFLQKVVNELDPNGSGDLVTRFLKINNEMRRSNNKTLSDLKFKTEPKFLWSQTFIQQPNSKVESNFADVRNYFYQGKKIDQQTHLGYDLSVTQHVGVTATNDGKVVYAAPLGIYGNCVVIDHGYGLQSIYGHLSEIGVKDGQMVKRGEVIGKSGQTGLAGGDHIHFSMQLEGVQIDPKSWWDSHWIQDHITKRVSLPSGAGD
ncbi:MAG TPA: M23 family metallopeptidase [Terriglobales bacterium]|nr:M23 family metallopeptidase [Terriglobales bacterium]